MLERRAYARALGTDHGRRSGVANSARRAVHTEDALDVVVPPPVAELGVPVQAPLQRRRVVGRVLARRISAELATGVAVDTEVDGVTALHAAAWEGKAAVRHRHECRPITGSNASR